MNSRVRSFHLSFNLQKLSIDRKTNASLRANILIPSVACGVAKENLILPDERETKDAVFSDKSIRKWPNCLGTQGSSWEEVGRPMGNSFTASFACVLL